MKVSRAITGTVLAITLAGGQAMAGGLDRHDSHALPHGAKVISVAPVYTSIDLAMSDGRCGPPDDDRRGRDAVAGTLIGGIVGGIVGNQVGKGSGNTATTIVGTVIGAVVGHEIGREFGDDARVDPGSRRCGPEGHHETRRKLVGYRVTYRHRGRVHETHTDEHPGNHVRPAHRARLVHF